MFRDSMNSWLQKAGIDITLELVTKTCEKVGVTGDDYDSCILLASAFDKGEINDDEFVVGMSELIHKTPEETEALLGGKSEGRPEQGDHSDTEVQPDAAASAAEPT